jgi:hypothetical protein
LVFMEEKTRYKEDELLTWSVDRYYNRIRYYAWQGHVQKKYSDIVNKPKKRK